MLVLLGSGACNKLSGNEVLGFWPSFQSHVFSKKMHGGCDVMRVLQQLREYTMLRVSFTKGRKRMWRHTPVSKMACLLRRSASMCSQRALLLRTPSSIGRKEHSILLRAWVRRGSIKESRISSEQRFCGETFNQNVLHTHTCVWLSRAENVNAQMHP